MANPYQGREIRAAEYTAYLPLADDRCKHDEMGVVTDAGIDLGPWAKVVRLDTPAGPQFKLQCLRCKRVGGPLPHRAVLDGVRVSHAPVPVRETTPYEHFGPRQGIPTRYRSTEFRSRLEARWAAFFDLIRWQWVYEPVDAAGYIPDFLIQGKRPFYVEVGNCVTPADYRVKAEKPLAARLDLPVVVVGASPEFATNEHCWFDLGLLIEPPSVSVDDEDRWKEANWGPCSCGVFAISRLDGSHDRHPCGHDEWPDDGEGFPWGLTGPVITWAWREAGNAVQWKPGR